MAIAGTGSVHGRANDLASRRPGALPFSTRGAGLVARLAAWDARFRARRALERLGPEMRADLGLGVEEIGREIAKPLWRP
jgi:uncharacterized protein YjiS (DUF1127 family)